MQESSDEELVMELVVGKRSWHELPEDLTGSKKARVRAEAVNQLIGESENQENKKADNINDEEVMDRAEGRSCENMIGLAKIPIGVVGPIGLENEKVLVPLATTEGALVASVSRGVRVLNASNEVRVRVETAGVGRAPVFRVKNLDEADNLRRYIDDNQGEIEAVAQSTSSHLQLMKADMYTVGRNVFLRLVFDTSEAMGMNMVTLAAEAVVRHIEQMFKVECVAVSGNMCVDKKPAYLNFLEGRGAKVWVEGVVPEDVVREVLKSDPGRLVEVVHRKQWLGSMMAGSLGFNAHFANIVAALYLATGQDLAHVVEGSMGITTAEMDGKDLYFSVYLPAVMMGSLGGGTHLPTQQQSLKMMGIEGKSGDRERLVKLLGMAVWAGEISLTGALAARHLGRAHITLGRK